MTRQDGADMRLTIGDGGDPESFTTIGGVREVQMEVNHQMMENSSLSSGKWNSVLDAAGNLDVSLSISGYFADSTTEETLRAHVFAGTQANMELHFGNGDTLLAPFVIARYIRAGAIDAEEGFSLGLRSAGEVSFVKG